MIDITLPVVELFKSIDGEGIRTGYPVTFIRLYGCNLRCHYCDTKYSYEEKDFTYMTIQQICDIVKELGLKRITLTGGEPLLLKNVKYLISELLTMGCEINIETNGSINLMYFKEYVRDPRVIITMDYKCPSSGMNLKMDMYNYKLLGSKDVVKFVVGNKEDLDTMKDILCSHNIKSNIFVSPVFGSIEPVEIVDYLLQNDLQDVRMQLQLHKIIWDPNERGV